MGAYGGIHRVHGGGVRRVTRAAVIARLDRAIQYSRGAGDQSKGRGVLGPPVKPGDDKFVGDASRLFLHVLDAGERDAFGAFADIAEIEFILGEEHRIAVDVVGDAGTIG
jgi:hypothetical protein